MAQCLIVKLIRKALNEILINEYEMIPTGILKPKK